MEPTEAQDQTATTEADPPVDASGEDFVEDDLLVEEISIDGMCGVY